MDRVLWLILLAATLDVVLSVIVLRAALTEATER